MKKAGRCRMLFFLFFLRRWLVCDVLRLVMIPHVRKRMQWFAHRWIKVRTCLRSLTIEMNYLNVQSKNSTHCLPAAQATCWIHTTMFWRWKTFECCRMCLFSLSQECFLCMHNSQGAKWKTWWRPWMHEKKKEKTARTYGIATVQGSNRNVAFALTQVCGKRKIFSRI